jgi:predicted permease
MLLELVHFWRMTRKQVGFTLTAVFVLTLGIAANTTIFAIINAVLLKPLPYYQPDSLVRISLDSERRGIQDSELSLTRYEQIRDSTQTLAAFAAFVPENFTLSIHDDPEQLQGVRISANFLSLLGVKPQVGRGFRDTEDVRGGPEVAMVSDALWRRQLGAQKEVIGSAVRLNSKVYTVIGVLPATFQFPYPETDVWVTKIAEQPDMKYGTPATVGYLTGFARVKQGVSLDQARAEMDTLSRRYGLEHSGNFDTDPSTIVRVVKIRDKIVQNVRPALLVLFGSVIFVLLIACANVASLLLTRAVSRAHEFALRTALGAARGTLFRQLMLESLLLALASSICGVLLAQLGLHAVMLASADKLPSTGEIVIDKQVLLFALALAIGTSVVFGLFPWLHAARPDLATILREHRTAGKPSRKVVGINARSLLVVGQVAMSIVLLIGAGLMIGSFARLRKVELGFEPSNLLTMQVVLPPSRYETDRTKGVFYQQLTERIATLPNVRGVAVAASLPTARPIQFPIQVAGQTLVNVGERPRGRWQAISPSYFHTMGIPLRRGREFTERDNTDSPWVVIINESLAHRFWREYPNGQDPVGHHMLFGPDNSISAEIVGIVADVHEATLDAETGPEAYMALAQRCPQTMNLMVRTVGEPRSFANVVRAQVIGIDADQPVSKVRTMTEVLESSIGPQRLTVLILSFFAVVAVVLAAVGIYGVISYSVTQRTQELGVRLALGAKRGDLLRLVLRQGLGLAVVGVAIGMSGAFILTRVLSRLLFQVSATDPATFLGITVLFMLVTLAASYIPARRAMGIDPIIALR